MNDKERRIDAAMRAAFKEQVVKLIEGSRSDPQQIPRVGLEVELFSTKKGIPASNEGFTKLSFGDVELGLSQGEIRTDPLLLRNPEELLNALLEREQETQRTLNDRDIIRIGAIPNLSIEDIQVSDKEKYRLVPGFHNSHRLRKDTLLGGVDFNRAECVGLFCSTQTNLQADSLQDAVDKTNRSFMISPYLIALGGNARVVDKKDTGINDIRMWAWEVSHDTRKERESLMNEELRIGTPQRYFTNIQDYFDRCAQHPFILDNVSAALPIGIGCYWLDTRIKFPTFEERSVPVVEYRALSAQPSAKEDVALSLFWLGRLEYSQTTLEPLMDLKLVHKNRDTALHKGLRGNLFSDGKRGDAIEVIRHELKKAREGLLGLGYAKQDVEEAFSPLYRRLETREAPADVFVREIATKSIEEVLMQYRLKS